MRPWNLEESAVREQRRSLLAAAPHQHGLDYVEVSKIPSSRISPKQPREPARWEIELYFVSSPPPALTPANILLLRPDDEAVCELVVTSVKAGTRALRVELRARDVSGPLPLARHEVLRIELVDVAGLDPIFSSAFFRLDGERVGSESTPVPGRPIGPESIDYLVKDYNSFRRLMLERMSELVPQWTERNAADEGIAVVEVLAYAADHLSYFQDAVASEAYLETAERRLSVRRHLRLLGYFVHQGHNSRTWVHFSVGAPECETSSGASGERAPTLKRALPDGPVLLPPRTQLLTRAGDPGGIDAPSAPYDEALRKGSLTFETMEEACLDPCLDRLSIHNWGIADFSLAKGATSLALVDPEPEREEPRLRTGDVLLLEENEPAVPGTGLPRRHVARLAQVSAPRVDPLVATKPQILEVELFADDALPFSLPVSRRGAGGESLELTVARGNIALADQGREVWEEFPTVPEEGRYTPRLGTRNLTFRVPFDPLSARRQSAAQALVQTTENALPAVELYLLPRGVAGDATPEMARRHGELWLPVRDLLESSRFARDFVIEVEEDGTPRIRFGNGSLGRAPAPGSRLVARYRIGNGPAGRIGADAIGHLVESGPVGTADELLPSAWIRGVRNPTRSSNGREAEPTNRARISGPEVFRRARRCVTPTDYVDRARRDPGVLDAAASLRWTGSWQTVFLYLQRPQATAAESGFEARIHALLEPFVLTGADFELRPPGRLALAVGLEIQAQPQAFQAHVTRGVLEALGSGSQADGSPGFFFPDRMKFGQEIFLGQVLDAALAVPGVESGRVVEFRPLAGSRRRAGTSESIQAGPYEIPVCLSDPSRPELGAVELEVKGGRR